MGADEIVVPAEKLAEPGPVVDIPDDQKLAVHEKPPPSANPVRIIIIGAGSRGQAYANAIEKATNGIVIAVAEPNEFKRRQFAQKYIHHGQNVTKDSDYPAEFESWIDFVAYERNFRKQAENATGRIDHGVSGVDAAFVCVQDAMHRSVLVALAESFCNLHIMCEKPLATNLKDCVDMYHALKSGGRQIVFSIGHVLRYSPHNMTLRKLLLEDKVIGDVLSVVHTEPVGWWHFTHSYVRGNWRREDTSGPSLLTKSCHDIDVLLWLLCSPTSYEGQADVQPHLPARVSSSGSLQYFKKSRKPAAAADATNCLSCPIEKDCKYSAKRIYLGDKPFMGLATGNTSWPVSIVVPEIEDLGAGEQGQQALLAKLSEDYGPEVLDADVAKRNWFGRCVYESDNDVLDEQIVTVSWDDEFTTVNEQKQLVKTAKQATFHMVAQTKRQCERFTRVYGTDGEMYADSYTITVEDFNTNKTSTYSPRLESRGHGGGDIGLTRQFVQAVDLVKNHGWTAAKAQKEVVRCTLEEVIRSHAMVFCAEEARVTGQSINWDEFWEREVEQKMPEGTTNGFTTAQRAPSRR